MQSGVYYLPHNLPARGQTRFPYTAVFQFGGRGLTMTPFDLTGNKRYLDLKDARATHFLPSTPPGEGEDDPSSRSDRLHHMPRPVRVLYP